MLPYFDFFGKAIPMYGLMIVTGIFAAVLFMLADCKRRGLLWEDAVIIGVTGLGCGIAGAKILYIFVTFSFGEFVYIIKSGQLQDVMSGGFVFYGGLIAGIFGAFLGAALAKTKLSRFENILIKTVPLVHAFGRIGCFFAGCCYGKPAGDGFGIVLKSAVSDAPRDVALIPVQLYESVFDFLLFAVLMFIDRKFPQNRVLLPIYIMAYSAERFVMEFFRYDSARGIFFGLSTSQWISIALALCGAAVLGVRFLHRGQVD